ncbi:MAG: PDZ domain-containing protein [Luteolibacter sp.]|uniref:PDZ domain-containing protein n=1 Tax=Luteolibacter sp. TaxID=1962973 RepID=UPI003263443B
MRIIFTLPLLFALTACDPSSSKPVTPPPVETPVAPSTVEVPAPVEIKNSVVRINSTQQSWNPAQPWEKDEPRQRRALAAIVGPKRVITTSEMVADATYLEFESPDGTHFAQAKVIAVDYEANLALLGPADEAEGNTLFEKTVPLALTEPPKIGDTLDVLQIEDNGLALLTPGNLRSIDITSNFLPGHGFLTYRVKASMQSAASSYSLPVLKDGKLTGVLISYDSKDQICDVASTDILSRFLKAAIAGDYKGFPSLGISIARTEDTSFRQWLKLKDDQGGLYVQAVRKGGAAELAGVKKGDVILTIDGHSIDRRGYYQHSNYGSVFWGHLVRGEKSAGDIISLSVQRDGQPLEIKATLTREEESSKLVPGYTFGKAPNFLIKGGLVFQELTRPLLEAYGKDWQSRAPLDFLDAMENPEKYEDRMERVIFLSGSIPTPATVGYESLRNLIVRKVNGKDIRDMKSLIDAFNGNLGELHSIEFDEEDFKVYLDDAVATEVDSQLLKRGIDRLSRAE